MNESTMTMPPEFLSSYTDSMPNSYRQQQSADEISEHARIVWRRGHELAHAEIWQKRLNAVVICIVCDEVPGLLALIRATIAAHGLDVLAAQAYLRKGAINRNEAVHFLWLSPKREGSSRHDWRRRRRSDRRGLGRALARRNRSRRGHRAGLAHPQFRKIADRRRLCVAPQRRRSHSAHRRGGRSPGPAHDDHHRSFCREISVIHSEVKTSGKRAQGRFHLLEADSTPLTQDRASAVARAVHAALSKTPE